ncbi:hypothetical protein BC938DRAFT_483468 [Jimgerdemannia flammicorona]|uniref:B30.2/SPRY domain-containing protein n=1 Tax=Jimgerdemannia flammicorona TaxID=994334 RepID=A0A433QC06_9FUNG|nr:hypothetical protein BC938DRAFT_483468 [Jimgerdemannia flammicorona]
MVLTEGGVHEWDILIESNGILENSPCNVLGAVGDIFSPTTSLCEIDPSWVLFCTPWNLQVRNSTNGVVNNTGGEPFRKGDVVTFHLDSATRRGDISVNGTRYSGVFTELPDQVYPAVTLHPGARYRLRTRA